MQNKFFKSVLTIFIIMLFVFTINVMATEDELNSDDVVVGDQSSEENEPATTSEDQNEEVEEDTNVSHDEDIGSTGSSSNETKNEVTSSTYTPPSQTLQPTSSYSTSATIPEANLSLNNILNVILIAIGVILILLAIAIFIRLK